MILLSLAFLFGCNKDKKEERLPFDWVKENNKLTYTYTSNTDTVENALTLLVSKSETNALRFEFAYPQGISVASYEIIGGYYNVYSREDGLYSSAPSGCDWVNIVSKFFMRAPINPREGMTYTLYRCGNEVSTTLEVKQTYTVIKTSIGSFLTYALRDNVTKKIEFWDPWNGLIRIDMADSTGTITGSYVLSHKNY